MKPKVSIIIPYFNHGEYLQGCLNSVFNSSYPNYDVILVNDSSIDDHSIEMFESINNEKVKKFTIPNGGPCSAKNFGVSQASGEIIGFLDSDNEFFSTYIEKAVNAISNSSVDWFFGDGEYFEGQTGIKNQKLKGKEEIFINSPIDNCLFIKKDVFEKIGAFDEELNRLGLEDWELTMRLITSDIPYGHLEEPLFRYRVSKESRSNNEAKENKDKIMRYVFNKHHDILYKLYSGLFFSNLKTKESKIYKYTNKLMTIIGRG